MPLRQVSPFQAQAVSEDDAGGEAKTRADASRAVFEEQGDIGALEAAEREYGEALEREQDDSKLAELHVNLSEVLRMRSDFTLGIKETSESVDHASIALSSTSPSDPHFPERLSCLARAQLTAWSRRNDPEDLEKARTNALRVIEVCPPAHPRLSFYLAQCAEVSYHSRITVQNPGDRIQEAKSYLERALATPPDDPSDLSFALMMASVVYTMCNVFSEPADRDYELPLGCAEKAFKHRPRPITDIHRVHSATALAYYSRYYLTRKGTREADELYLAIRHFRSAAAAIPETHQAWKTHQTNIAGFSLEIFEREGSLDSLDEAIATYRNIIPLFPRDHMNRPNRLSFFGRCLMHSFHHRGGVDQLDQAIEVQREAVELSNSGEIGEYLLNLAATLLERFMLQREPQDLDQAITHLRDACARALPSVKSSALADLGYALNVRSSSLHNAGDLNEAIECFKTVQDTGSHVLDVPRYQYDFGSALLHRFQEQHVLEDLVAAVELFGKAAAASSRANVAEVYCRLGMSNRLLFHARPHTGQLELSITNLRNAAEQTQRGSSQSALHCYELAVSLRDRYYITMDVSDWTEAIALLEAASKDKPSITRDRWNAAREQARLLHEGGAYDAALEAYRLAIELMPRMAWLGLDQKIRYETSQQWIRLGSDAAACAISAGHMEQAVELLESSRSVLWNQLYQLGQEQGDLRALAPELASELEAVGRALESNLGQNVRMLSTEPRGEDEETRARRRLVAAERNAAERRRLAEKWDVLMDQVRSLPESPHFLGSAPFSSLREAASAGPVVLLNLSQYRCDGLIVTHNSPIRQFLFPTLRLELIELWAVHLILVLQQSKDAEGLAFADRVLDTLLAQLWQDVGYPMWCNLKDLLPPKPRLGRIWLLPTGALASLPLHAAMSFGPVRFGLPDLVISSYTPTLTALIRARKQADASLGTSFRILAVGQPSAVGRKPLPCWAQEKQSIQRLFPPDRVTILESEEATVERVISELNDHNFVHICSHGEHNWTDPFNSRLVLHDGPLTLTRIAQQRFASADFAFLSACHTARVDPRAPDESVHLASGMNLAGFRSIIATMWGIADLDAPAATHNVYDHLTKNTGSSPDHRGAAEALHHSVAALRRSGVPVCRWAPFIHIGV